MSDTRQPAQVRAGGDRVLEERNDSGGPLVRYTTEDGSYYSPMLHMKHADGRSRFPLYDALGHVHRLVDGAGAATDTYDYDAFGRVLESTGTTPNPCRFGGAWRHSTDPSGLLQLGARFYWPEMMIIGVYGSPDGKRVTFLEELPGHLPGARMSLRVIPVSGGVPTVVADDAWPWSRLAWSPDGTRIAYTRAEDGKITVARIPDKQLRAWGRRATTNRGWSGDIRTQAWLSRVTTCGDTGR